MRRYLTMRSGQVGGSKNWKICVEEKNQEKKNKIKEII